MYNERNKLKAANLQRELKSEQRNLLIVQKCEHYRSATSNCWQLLIQEKGNNIILSMRKKERGSGIGTLLEHTWLHKQSTTIVQHIEKIHARSTGKQLHVKAQSTRLLAAEFQEPYYPHLFLLLNISRLSSFCLAKLAVKPFKEIQIPHLFRWINRSSNLVIVENSPSTIL